MKDYKGDEDKLQEGLKDAETVSESKGGNQTDEKMIKGELGGNILTVSEIRLLLRGIINRAERSGKRLTVNLSVHELGLLRFLAYHYKWYFE